MRTAREVAQAFKDKNPVLTDEQALHTAFLCAMQSDPRQDDPDATALIPASTAGLDHSFERWRVGSGLLMPQADPLVDQFLDALEIAWSYPADQWYRELRWCVLRSYYANGLAELESALVVRAWCGQRLSEIIADPETPNPRHRAAALALLALLGLTPQLKPQVRDALKQAALTWPEQADVLRDAADFGVDVHVARPIRDALQSLPQTGDSQQPVLPTEPQLDLTTPSNDPEEPWLTRFSEWLQGATPKVRRYAVLTLAGLEGQGQRRATPWICEHLLEPAIGPEANAENGAIKRCLAILAREFGLLDSRKGGKPGYVLQRERWERAKSHPTVARVLGPSDSR